MLAERECKICGVWFRPKRKLNRALRTEDGEVYDIIAGNFLVVGLGSEDFASLSNELVAKYKDYFGVPEIFLKVNGKLHILPASPKE